MRVRVYALLQSNFDINTQHIANFLRKEKKKKLADCPTTSVGVNETANAERTFFRNNSPAEREYTKKLLYFIYYLSGLSWKNSHFRQSESVLFYDSTIIFFACTLEYFQIFMYADICLVLPDGLDCDMLRKFTVEREYLENLR